MTEVDTYWIDHPEQHTQECLDYAEHTMKESGRAFCIAVCADTRSLKIEPEPEVCGVYKYSPIGRSVVGIEWDNDRCAESSSEEDSMCIAHLRALRRVTHG